MKNANPGTALTPSGLHVLLALASGDKHGWGILKEVSRATEGQIELSTGTLYGLIKRLLRDELIAESDDRPPLDWDDERRRYYRLTQRGRRVAMEELARLERTLAVARRCGLAAGGVR